ncbi:carbohydrate-binding protein, partial [Micromonospora sp. URMC 107]
PTAAPTTPPAPGGTWTAGRAYQVGDQVTYGGLTYRCRQAHTALPGWEPPHVPALWTQV